MLGSGRTGVPKPPRELGRNYQLGQERRDAHGGNQSPADDDKLVAMINRLVWAFGSSQADHKTLWRIAAATCAAWPSRGMRRSGSPTSSSTGSALVLCRRSRSWPGGRRRCSPCRRRVCAGGLHQSPRRCPADRGAAAFLTGGGFRRAALAGARLGSPRLPSGFRVVRTVPRPPQPRSGDSAACG